MESLTLEDVIRQNVQLNHMNAKGWHTCVHAGCDHGRKGDRAAFLFDGDTTVFHCYNCSVKTKYVPSDHRTMPQKMEKVLSDFGIPDSDWKKVVFNNMAKHINPIGKKLAKDTFLKIEPTVLPVPSEFYFLKDALATDVIATKAKEYLKSERGIPWASYPFMLANKSDDMMMRKWLNRLIIPIYNHLGQLVFYQGRDITGKAQKKYQSPPANASRIIHGFDKIYSYVSDTPLYVVEGWFDAHLLDGIALLGNSISEEQAEWINKSKRPIVYIPDRFGNGKEVAMHALSLGWSISTPDVGSDTTCKDITDIVKKYGKIYTMKTLAEKTASGFAAKTQLALYCKK